MDQCWKSIVSHDHVLIAKLQKDWLNDDTKLL